METMFYLSLIFNVFLISALFTCLYKKKTELQEKKLVLTNTQNVPVEQNISKSSGERIMNLYLHDLAKKCNACLPSEYQGMIKILVEKKNPEQPAVLQIGLLNISLKREERNQSMFDVHTPLDALTMACYGYNGTGRYIPVPSELEYIIQNKDIINVYFQALGLEVISEEKKYWTVDTETGWNTGWKRFDWSIEKAYAKLKDKFKIWSQNKHADCRISEDTKLILLLKGWEHLFAEA